jgi:hypothetical protein
MDPHNQMAPITEVCIPSIHQQPVNIFLTLVSMKDGADSG